MTTESEARNAIYKKFLDDWGGILASQGAETDVAIDNINYNPIPEQEYCRISVRHTLGRQDTLGSAGNRKFERRGNIIIQILTPAGTATNRSDELARKARNAFEGQSIPNTNIIINNVSQRETGVVDDVWFQVVVDAEFLYNETK